MVALSAALPALRRAWQHADGADRVTIARVAAVLIEIAQPVETAA